MGKLSNDELEVVYKQGMKPSVYLAYKCWFNSVALTR